MSNDHRSGHTPTDDLAWSMVADAAEAALALPSLSRLGRRDLEEMMSASRCAAGQTEPMGDGIAREAAAGIAAMEAWLAHPSVVVDMSSEYAEWRERNRIAHDEGGVLAWDLLPIDIRRVLYNGQVLSVDEVRELAARPGELRAINGIGPTRERAILVALAATDCDGDWLS
jgi:hypothetical protein